MGGGGWGGRRGGVGGVGGRGYGVGGRGGGGCEAKEVRGEEGGWVVVRQVLLGADGGGVGIVSTIS